MSKPVLIPAQDKDVAFLQHCAHDAYEIYVPRIGKKPAPMVADFATHVEREEIELLCLNQEPIGFAVSYPSDDHLFIENIALIPSAQGRGYGRTMMRLLEARAQERELGALELYTNANMTENLNFYARLGFVVVDRRNEDGFDRIYFRKNLSVSLMIYRPI